MASTFDRQLHITLAVDAIYADHPGDAPETYLVIQDSHGRAFGKERYTIQAFFSAKRWTVASRQSADNRQGRLHTYRLTNGASLMLLDVSSTQHANHRSEPDALVQPGVSAEFSLEQISSSGYLPVATSDPGWAEAAWLHPSVIRSPYLDQPGLLCDPIHWGLQAFDSQGKRIWQNVIAVRGKRVPKALGKGGGKGSSAYLDTCWTPGVRYMGSVQAFGPPRRDGTVLVVLGGAYSSESMGVLRIRLGSGWPDHLPSEVKIVEYAGLARFKTVLGNARDERSSSPQNIVNGRRFADASAEGASGELNEQLLIQSYFFPALLREGR